MGSCNCGKQKMATQPKKIVKSQTKPINKQTNTLKRIIKRTAY